MEKTTEKESMEKCARERLEKELRELNLNPPTCISLGPVSKDDMFHWQAIIIGPVDTQLEGTLFHLSIQFPIDYPFKPPTVRFQTQLYHPNIGGDGTVLIDILGDRWSPSLDAEKLLLSITSILFDPVLEGLDTVLEDLQSLGSCSSRKNCYKKKGGGWNTLKWRFGPVIKFLLFLRSESYGCKSGKRAKTSSCSPL
ncbi:Ubiquitin--protein ligase [Bertholletia excelsa]